MSSKMENCRRRLIVTADDYGLCDVVNQAIEECMAVGAVQATCVMANMSAFEGAAALREKFPQSSIGIHWNVTQGRPVLPWSQVHSLVNSDGSFYPAAELRWRWLTRRVSLDELCSELRAQSERLSKVIGRPDFWNTHQNIHVFPGLFQAFVALGNELGVPAMRCHRRFTVPHNTGTLHYQLTHPRYWLKGQIIALWSTRAEASGTLMPDGRLYLPGYRTALVPVDVLAKALPWRSVKKAVELVIHPATEVREELFGDLTKSRVCEYRRFKDPGLAARLRESGIKPVGFEALHPPASA